MSFRPYPSYKDSGIAWAPRIPNHWKVSRIKFVAPFTTGFTPPTGNDSLYGGEYAWANIADLGPQVVMNTAKTVTATAVQRYAGPISPAGSLLFSFKLSVGQVSIAGRDMYTNEAIATFRASADVIVPFAYYSWPLFLPHNAAENIYGAQLLNAELIGSAQVLLPPPHEQRLIVDFLDAEIAKIDALIAEQDRLIELLNEKRQAVISHAVTKGQNPSSLTKDSGVPWIGRVPAHWELTQLRRIIAQGTTITYGIVQAGPDVEGGVPYIRTSDMAGASLLQDGYLRTSPEIDASYARSKVRPGDLVVAIRATLGKALRVPEYLDGANLTQGTARVSPGKGVDSEFLFYSFNSEYCQTSILQAAKGATFLEITLAALRRLPFLLPPMQEQRALAAYARQQASMFDQLVSESRKAVALLAERRTALISAAVTGQIDVRGFAKETAA